MGTELWQREEEGDSSASLTLGMKAVLSMGLSQEVVNRSWGGCYT